MTDERRELKKIAFEANMGLDEVGREILGSMPEGFVFAYELMWLAAYGSAVGGRPGGAEPNIIAKARRVVRVSTNQTETRGGANPGGVAGMERRDVISNEAALEQLRRVNRKLRVIAREMKLWMNAGQLRAGNRRCSVCKRYGDDEWVYCPSDGKPMEEV